MRLKEAGWPSTPADGSGPIAIKGKLHGTDLVILANRNCYYIASVELISKLGSISIFEKAFNREGRIITAQSS